MNIFLGIIIHLCLLYILLGISFLINYYHVILITLLISLIIEYNIHLKLHSLKIKPNSCYIVEKNGVFKKIIKSKKDELLYNDYDLKYVKWSRLNENENLETYNHYLIPLNNQLYKSPFCYNLKFSNNKQFNIQYTIIFKIIDVKKAIYEIDNLWNLINIIRTISNQVVLSSNTQVIC
jgi:hypothetical protein